MKRYLWILFLGSALSAPLAGQQAARPLVTQPIDERRLVQLHGNIHPFAQAQYDQGAVPDSFPAKRMLLLLNRPSEREIALQQFLNDVHQRGSANYHHWLTPQEFGNRFGPADADIQAVTGWLHSQGFNIARVTGSEQFIEFSGTAGQIRNALHTEIHRYEVAGETHYANAGEISIPLALAAVVRGIAPLNDFGSEAYVRVGGEASYSPSTKKATPEWTIPNPFGTPNPNAYLVAPEDLATQYDLAPLYQTGVNGSGQTIGIINESNIDLSSVAAYQQLFNLPANPTQVVIDGSDPGTNNAEVEAYLDVEVSDAVAPRSTVNLYISDGGGISDPLEFAAIRAVEDNQASVLSVSFGNCELTLGDAGNLFWYSLWEQAAAQGQTVFVAAGDSGPYCNEIFPNAVSGITSTPWNVSVGGTDFYYSDYASGGATATTLWNQTNDPSLGSLKAPLPEQPWDDGFGLDVISDGLTRGEFGAGGGGVSNCINISSTTDECTNGYSKPHWQTGPGVPADGARDLPDISLFASNGANLSGYAICAYSDECSVGSAGQANVLIVGGTSASSPVMAGIMALVDQKYGRQGQANFTFYPLAQQKPAAFHDVTLGTNSVPCNSQDANCSQNSSGTYQTTVYAAGPNYDLASGLGSVDGNVLVTAWNSITFTPTSTTLQLSPSTITHGTPVTATVAVSSSTGSGTPTGSVAILTNSPLPSNQSQGVVTLGAGAGSTSINYFPGGYYDVSANYQGDGVFAGSTSQPVPLTINPENSTLAITMSSRSTTIAAGSSLPYGAPLVLTVQPLGVNAAQGQTDGSATGTTTFKVDSTAATVPLDTEGLASWTLPALSLGAHTASATYSGDPSFNPSSAPPVTFTVTQGVPFINATPVAPNPVFNFQVIAGSSLTVNVEVGPTNGILTGTPTPLGSEVPTGTVKVCLGLNASLDSVCVNPVYSQTATLAPLNGEFAEYSSANVTLSNLAAGYYTLTISYSGDAYWQSWGLYITNEVYVIPPPTKASSTTMLSITPASISGSQYATIATTVTGSGNSGVDPTGVVQFYDNGAPLTYALLLPGNTAGTGSFSFYLVPSAFLTNGANQITAVYEGDTNYQPSTSNAASLTVTQAVGDFTLTPQLPQIAVQSGGSGTVGLNLISVNNFNGVVNLSCAPSSSNITCSLNPSAAPLNGAATAMLMITAAPQTSALPLHSRRPFALPGAGAILALVFLVLAISAIRTRRPAVLVNACLLACLLLVAGCGGGSSVQTPPPPPPPPNGVVYSVVVTGTANGVIHNAKIMVVVP